MISRKGGTKIYSVLVAWDYGEVEEYAVLGDGPLSARISAEREFGRMLERADEIEIRRNLRVHIMPHTKTQKRIKFDPVEFRERQEELHERL